MKAINIILRTTPGPYSIFVDIEDDHGISRKIGTVIRDPESEYYKIRITAKDLKE